MHQADAVGGGSVLRDFVRGSKENPDPEESGKNTHPDPGENNRPGTSHVPIGSPYVHFYTIMY